MAKEVKITCDGCDKDITSTGASPQFRLHLLAEALPHTSNIVHAVLVYPPIKQDCYFCSLSCLGGWLTLRAADVSTRG